MITSKTSSISTNNDFSGRITDIYKLFNLRLFEYNQKIKKYSSKKKSKFYLNDIQNNYFHKDINKDKNPLLTIEHCTKEKNKSKSLDNKFLSLKNKNQILIFKRPLTNKKNNYQTYLNLALVPLKNKRKKIDLNDKEKSLISEERKIDIKKLKLDSPQKPTFDKYLFDDFLGINQENEPEDDYSDCKSLKGIILSIKQKIRENRYKLNKTFNEFDKQILQDQYLLERFYEMQKCFPNRSKIKYYKNKLKNKQKLFNAIKNKNSNLKFNNYNNKKYK